MAGSTGCFEACGPRRRRTTRRVGSETMNLRILAATVSTLVLPAVLTGCVGRLGGSVGQLGRAAPVRRAEPPAGALPERERPVARAAAQQRRLRGPRSQR